MLEDLPFMERDDSPSHDQLVSCEHPGCMSLPEVMLEAQWGPDEWEDLEVCHPHIPWGCNWLMRRPGRERTPEMVCIHLPSTVLN